MSEKIVKHLYISGRVQGVGFRHFIRSRAAELGLQGWVRNLNDGRVELLAAGEKQKVETLIRQASRGPSWARVDGIEINDAGKMMGSDYQGFQVRY